MVVLGDESGYTANQHQKMKIAAMESMWHTEPAPAPFIVFGIPDVQNRTTHAEVKSALDARPDRHPLHRPGGPGHLRTGRGCPRTHRRRHSRVHRVAGGAGGPPTTRPPGQVLEAHAGDLGYALLLRRYVADPATATTAQIDQAAWDTVPSVGWLFWSFRVMVALGFFFIVLFGWGFWLAARRSCDRQQGFLRIAVWSLPLPWLAAELGWVVAEHGRQPWAIEGVLPTFLAVSPISVSIVATSLAGFVLFYTTLAVVDVMLLGKYIQPRSQFFRRRSAALMERAMPIDFATLKVIWWLLLGVLLPGFAIMDGFDLGAAMLLPFVGRTDAERRVAINTVGPVWEGNQVWLILGGGAIFAAWPALYAAVSQASTWRCCWCWPH